ncbi:hypothetical protein [Sphingomonas molluscorum]|uniref:hypothetical protein n=1 Tax=Sphingomonas molluscorum TaxID=418184 RepID=UPI0031D2B36C
MPNVSKEAHAHVCLLDNEQIAALQRTASRNHEPPAQLAAIMALIPCSAAAIASAPIEMIDRNQGLLRVKDPSGFVAEVALGHDAAMTIAAAIYDRHDGPLLDDGFGRGITADKDTEDYARELLASDNEEPITFTWSFRLLRESVFANMADDGVAHHIAMAQAGLGIGHVKDIDRAQMLFDQRAAADWWSYRLGLMPPSPFALIDGGARAPIRRSGLPPFRPGRAG